MFVNQCKLMIGFQIDKSLVATSYHYFIVFKGNNYIAQTKRALGRNG